MIKYFIILVIIGFGVLYGVQIAAYCSLETLDTKTFNVRGLEPIEVSIMLGGTPTEKFIPGLGASRILTEEPCRYEVRYKDQKVWHTVEKRKHADLKSVKIFPTRSAIFIRFTVKGNLERLEVKP